MHRCLNDVVQCGPVREQVEMLKHHPDIAALLGGFPRGHLIQLVAGLAITDQLFVNVEPTGRHRLQMIDAPQKGRFPRTRRPDENEHLPALHRQCHAFEHRQRTKALTDLLGPHHRRHT